MGSHIIDLISINSANMKEAHLSIQEAAELCGRSIQTIRRAIKAKKISCKKQKTPQGFNYLIKKSSLTKAYKLKVISKPRKQAGLKRVRAVSQIYATTDDLQKIHADLERIMVDSKKEKENFMRLMKAFQDKFIALENQMKLIEEPNEKKWFEFWR